MSKKSPDEDNSSAPRSPEDIPQTLRELPRWICWRYEQGGEKKPPYDPETDQRASIHKPESWSDLNTAIDRCREGDYEGIGFVLTEDGPLTGIDLDDCRNPETGEIVPEVESIIERLDSYSEISPSGTGIHTLIQGEKPEGYGSTGGAYIEIYDSVRYLTVTGEHLEETPKTIETRDDELQRLCETYLNQTGSGEIEDIDTDEIDSDDSRIEAGKEALNDLWEESTLVFTDVMKFLQGGISKFDKSELLHEDGLIDVSGQEYIGISLLYSTLNRYLDGDSPEIQETTWATWTYYCREHPTTEHSQKRRWLTDTDRYRREIFNHAIAMADEEIFETMIEEKGAGTRRENNEYSKMTYSAIWDALYELTPSIEEAESLLSSPPHPV